MTRRLVTLRTVSALTPIEGADRIELATVDGWQCVVKKGEFKVGERGLYFEIDSFLPASDSRFDFLAKEKKCWKNREGYRLQTRRFQKQLSQGLLRPLSEFPEVKQRYFSDTDYADLLGVVKWERDTETVKVPKKKTWLSKVVSKYKHTRLRPFLLWLEVRFPSWFAREATRPFPRFVPKTDEERVQNCLARLVTYRDLGIRFHRTVKLDGSSMTVYYNRGKVGVCSRNLDLKKDKDNAFWSVVLGNNLDKALKKLGRNIALQGELMGPGIQKNREKLSKLEYYLFKAYDIDSNNYLSRDERSALVADLRLAGATLYQVPSLGVDDLSKFPSIAEFLAFAEGASLNAETREGVVFESMDGAFSFKVISNSYLLEKGN